MVRRLVSVAAFKQNGGSHPLIIEGGT